MIEIKLTIRITPFKNKISLLRETTIINYHTIIKSYCKQSFFAIILKIGKYPRKSICPSSFHNISFIINYYPSQAFSIYLDSIIFNRLNDSKISVCLSNIYLFTAIYYLPFSNSPTLNGVNQYCIYIQNKKGVILRDSHMIDNSFQKKQLSY